MRKKNPQPGKTKKSLQRPGRPGPGDEKKTDEMSRAKEADPKPGDPRADQEIAVDNWNF
jgi:hypothetical protein